MSENGIAHIRNWHVVLALLTWLVLAVVAFATLRTQMEEVQRRVQDLEKQKVLTYDQYRDGQEVINQRLTRIENKLDRERK